MNNYAKVRLACQQVLLFFFIDHRARVYEHENKNCGGFIDHYRKGSSLTHSQRLEAVMKVFRCSTDYRIRISGLRFFFLLPDRILFGQE